MARLVTGMLTASNVLPQTQNTAPVLEFRCLYTSDIRRKQKRWQDGRLKFHTFNKRIMVYDDRSNFVGDSHWREDHTFAEGEEVELERRGILVEVSECVGARDQDLTPLFGRVVKDRQERTPSRCSASSPFRSPGASTKTQTVDLTLSNPIEPRPPKRRKFSNSPSSKHGYAQSLTGVKLTLPGTPSNTAPLRYDPLWLRTLKQPIERADPLDSGKVHRLPQENWVARSTTKPKVGGSQRKRGSERFTLAHYGSCYAHNITGTALVLVRKTPATRGPISAFAKCEIATSTTMQEDEFIDIDVYDEPPPDERVPSSSTQTIKQLNAPQACDPPQLTPGQACVEDEQHDKPFNPLRIKKRPKRKLLLIETPQSHRPLTEPGRANVKKTVCFPIFQEGGCEPLVPRPTEYAVPEIGQSGVTGRHLHSPINDGIDNNCIDGLLARKCTGQTSMIGNQQRQVEAQTWNDNSIGSVEMLPQLDWMENVRGMLNKMPDLQIKSKPNLTQAWKQPFMLPEHPNLEIKKGNAETFNISESSRPPLVKTPSQEPEANEPHGITTAIAITEEDNRNIVFSRQANVDKARNHDVIPWKQPAKLAGPKTRGKRGETPETISSHMMAGAEILITTPQVQVPRRDRDQGAWSREAFDLFEWRPGPSPEDESLKVG